MERLTFDGNFCDIALCSEVRYGSFCEDGSCSQRRVWERLKQYEDTGLEPEDIRRAFDEDAVLKLAGGVLGLEPDCLRELAEADRKGRCVVLPCKIGDTLNKCVNQAREFEELYTKLYAATGFTAEKLLEMFAAGYVLQKPDYSKQLAEMANLAEAEAALREG
jgi:hypothetical protein